MYNLLSAIAYINSRGVLHRDIKPENILLRSNNDDLDIVVTDFGLSENYRPDGEYLNKRVGTPGYVAPEVLHDELYDYKIDAFSCGVIMYTLFTRT